MRERQGILRSMLEQVMMSYRVATCRGGQEQMRDEEDYEEKDEVDFVNQTGTRYSSKPFSTNASALGVRAVGKGQGSDHCALVQNGDSPQPHKQGTQTIRARVGQGIGNGWDPGPPVWDPGTPMNGLQTQRPHLTLWLEEVDLNRYPTAQARAQLILTLSLSL